MKRLCLLLALSACGGDGTASDPDASPAPDAIPYDQRALHTVFVILMENHNWAAPSPGPVIVGNPSAPYLNALLPTAAYAMSYRNPPGLHPSEPNYVWLEGGTNFGITTDAPPSDTHSVASTDHLVNLLDDAGVTWRAYAEGIPGGTCPLASTTHYVARHVPFLMYQDVTGGNDPSAARCIEHVVPFSQLAGDLAAGTTADYDFITPDLCDDMHGASGCPSDLVRAGDTWLASVVPMIMQSSVYQDGHAAILIAFDESEHGEYPIGMIAISPHARAGYASTVPFTHSSTLRTLEEVFAVHPLLGDAANATSLSDLFSEYP